MDTNRPPSFSVVLIARQEALTLPRLIASLKEFQSRGGEVILVDTGSTDGTPELARSLGCIVFEEGERFITTIEEVRCKQINRRFVAKGEKPVVAIGDKLFDYSAARNYAALKSRNEWVFMPDCDEILTALDLDEIERVISDPSVDQLEYEFVYSHQSDGSPGLQFLHSKFYRRPMPLKPGGMFWRGIVHEVLQPACV